MTISIDRLQAHLGLLNEASHIELITKGYFTDQKYLVVTESGQKLLLRVMPIGQFDRKQVEFQLIKQMYASDIKVPEPKVINRIDDLQVCYYVLSYIDGTDAQDTLPKYVEDVQFHIGLEAGKDLRRTHQYSTPQPVGPWYERCMKKHYAYAEAYKTIGVTLTHADRILQFIEDNQRYIQYRPNQFQHDDFHVGNMIVKDGSYAATIDFNRYDWGDPIHDFLKVGFFSADVSIPFCVGQVHGYFKHGRIPQHFWNLYAIYLAMTIFSSVVWTMRVVPDQIDDMVERIYRVLHQHRYFESIIPDWYTD